MAPFHRHCLLRISELRLGKYCHCLIINITSSNCSVWCLRMLYKFAFDGGVYWILIAMTEANELPETWTNKLYEIIAIKTTVGTVVKVKRLQHERSICLYVLLLRCRYSDFFLKRGRFYYNANRLLCAHSSRRRRQSLIYGSQSLEKRDHAPHLSEINLHYYGIQLNHKDL